MKLCRVSELYKELGSAERELENLRRISLPTPRLDGMPKAKGQASQVEIIAQKIIECERRIEEIKMAIVDTSLELLKEIFERVKSPNGQDVLIRRYVTCQSFKEIAAAKNYSDTRIFALHRIGKREFNAAEKSAYINGELER